MKTFIPIKGDGLNPALEEDLAKIRFPVLASPKLDGIRAVVRNGELLSYRLKLIPNLFTQERFREYEGLDGELVIKQKTMTNLFRNTSSAVMSRDGKPDVRFLAFDIHNDPMNSPFWERQDELSSLIESLDTPHVDMVRHTKLHDIDELLQFETNALVLGYEGVILRCPMGPYKYGRSTIKEGYLIKLKREVQEEAVVVDFKERMKNNNVQTRDEHGRAKRSSHKANKVGHGDLGTLVVRSDKYKKDFEIGSGFTAKERKELWAQRKSLKGKIVTFKYSAVGDYDVPRFPVFVGFRDPIDL